MLIFWLWDHDLRGEKKKTRVSHSTDCAAQVPLASYFRGFLNYLVIPWLSIPIHSIKKLNRSSFLLWRPTSLYADFHLIPWLQTPILFMHLMFLDPEPSASIFLEQKIPSFLKEEEVVCMIQPLHLRLSNITFFVLFFLTLPTLNLKPHPCLFRDILPPSVESLGRLCWVNSFPCLCRQPRVYLPLFS